MGQKKVVYKITRTRFQLVEVETEEQEELIKELNRNFEREEKREKKMQAKVLSLDKMTESGGIEIADNSPNAEDIYLVKTEKEEMKVFVHIILKHLTQRQREVVFKVFWERKTFREIGVDLGVHFTTIAEIYHASIKKLQKFLKKYPYKTFTIFQL